MLRRFSIVPLLLISSTLQAAPPQVPGQSYAKDIQPLLKKYCWDCHAEGEKKGDLALDAFADEAAIWAGKKTWSTVQFHMENWMMPPAKKEQPTPAERLTITHYLDLLLNPFDPNKPDPGRVTIRRLNRVEYNNTIRDLLGVDARPADEFPEDDTGYGFDTIGAVLSLPPILMERYLSAAEKVLDLALPLGAEDLATKYYPSSAISGNGVLGSNGRASVDHTFTEEGEYVMKAKVWASQAGPELAKVDLRVNGEVFGKFDVKSADEKKPDLFSVKFHAQTGQKGLGVSFLNDFYDPNNPDPNRRDRNVYVLGIQVDGPLKSAANPGAASQKIFAALVKGATTEDAARAAIQNFANRAFRRSALPQEIDRLLTMFRLARKKGDSFREALKLSMRAVMVSPYFLFRTEWQPEPDNPEQVVDIDEFSLASRMSYFLWSSMPDDELLSLAFRKELRSHLRDQVQRMLRDPKARALSENFAGQWLETRTLQVVQPDPQRFPFPPELRQAMQQETREFFWFIQQENRSVLEFVSAPYTFVNERLAKHYGLEGVSGEQFRKVDLPPSSLRSGVLTQGSVLTLTSDPTRTSPVKRGKWIVENILGIAAPPPPPNVPALDGPDKAAIHGTVRQRLEQHRSNPGCASCHALLDPMGFGLEHFNAIGALRQDDNGQALDTTGVLTTGQKFSNARELSDVILRDKRDAFVRNLIRKTLTYSLGRGTEAYDRPAIDKILAAMNAEDYHFQTLVIQVIESLPFQKRRGDAASPASK